MKKKILFNGVLYEESDNAKTGYEVDTDTQSHFWYIDHTLNSHRGCRDNIPETIDAYVRVGNYFNSEKLCTNIAYIQTFYNCLRLSQQLIGMTQIFLNTISHLRWHKTVIDRQ